MRDRRPVGMWPLLALVAACETGPEPAAPAAPVRPERFTRSADARAPVPSLSAAPVQSGRVATPVTTPPTSTWISPREREVFAEPRTDAEVLGRIAAREPFEVHGTEPGEGCRGGRWGRVALGGYVCLHRATASHGSPRSLPVVLPDELTPFIYVRRRKSGDPALEIGRWRNRGAIYRGDPPVDTIEPHRIYAFVDQRRSRRFGPLLVDDHRGVIRERQVQRLEPSQLAGVELDGPPPAGTRLAWSIVWPRADVFDEPGATEPSGAIPFQTTVFVKPDPRWHDGQAWYPVSGGGWVHHDQIRRWLPGDPDPDVGAEEVWADVELHQQTLALYRGDTPFFVTLVSTGTSRHPTPRGTHFVRLKQAHGKMESRDEADAPYYVEDVPWVLYFKGRHALHGVAWHNRFGRRASHGCVNLAPRDAARVFAALGPDLPAGWLARTATEETPGARVRIRKAG